MAEYLARVTWKKIRSYREEYAAAEGSRRLPLTDQYGSDQRALDKLKFKDGLWLFTAPVLGYGSRRRTLPPSVLGRVSITHQWNRGAPSMQLAVGAPSGTAPMCDTRMRNVSEGYKYWRCGIPGESLPIHNAFSLFKSLTFEGRVKRVSASCKGCNPSSVPKHGPFGHLMQHYQSIRQLTDDSVTLLSKLNDHVVTRHTLFLSHKHQEAGSLVREVAGHLRDHALCWWDVQAIPQTRRYADHTLQDMLSDGIRQAGCFVAFLTPGYATSGWTHDELKEAEAISSDPSLTRRPKILPVLLGGCLKERTEVQQPISVGENAKMIAAEIRKRLQSFD